jgi:hypothetical protein
MIGYIEPAKLGITGILLGLILLLFGRKLFWFLIAAVGFYVGLLFATRYLDIGDDWHGILIGFCCGAAGVLILYAIQKIALSILGFLTGVFLTFNLIEHFHFTFHWWLLVIGGIIGVIIAASFFQLALIVLSSLFGSFMVVREMPSESSVRSIIYILLAAMGFIVQYSMMKRKRDKKDKPPEPD